MADFDIDTRELDLFSEELEDLQRLFPKESRKLMQRSGNKARSVVVDKAKQIVKKKTGNYLKSIKRGKVWVSEDGTKVRVYSAAPHAHLIEKGHRIVDKDGTEHGFVAGVHVFDKAEREIESQWGTILEQEFNRIMSKL
ncbi:HK97 gp10 family phage protein [Cohnella abietis]|uniref:HK97 gp10 family phage protein n=1 Tax=Cohnella abietis TaxID=2507935 RepID=A0A3T1D3A5_9BACL|nr:HK97 gp10 family phage protein [Cohnella abietis]BBI32485.1 hypothetical protein KCTCHS21_18840 [Cohnella abietis]